jgi:hypothetical protein
MGSKISCCVEPPSPRTSRKYRAGGGSSTDNFYTHHLDDESFVNSNHGLFAVAGVCGGGSWLREESTILQHISEREPDDVNQDPSSHPTKGSLFMERSQSDMKIREYRRSMYEAAYLPTVPYSDSCPILVGQNGTVVKKASSCSTIYIDDSTISQPNLKNTIKCISLAVYYHIVNRRLQRKEARAGDASGFSVAGSSASVGNHAAHDLPLPAVAQPATSETSNGTCVGRMPNRLLSGIHGSSAVAAASSGNGSVGSSGEDRVMEIFDEKLHPLNREGVPRDYDRQNPEHRHIYRFIRTLFNAAQLTAECAIITLVYIERLLTYAELDICPSNWRRIVLGAILLASKVWDDQAVWNVDYCQILKDATVEDMNELERQFLECLQFNINVPSSVYAKYYFDLRTLALANDLHLPLQPLSRERANKLEALSRLAEDRLVDTKRTARRWTSLDRFISSPRSTVVLS